MVVPVNNLLKRISEEIKDFSSPLSLNDLENLCKKEGIIGHLAIIQEPYITKILNGEKTVELRFSKNKIPPFSVIKPNTIIFLKESSGPLRGIVEVLKVEYFGPLGKKDAEELVNAILTKKYAENGFPAQWKDFKYATLIFIKDIIKLQNHKIEKTDRRSWVILNKLT